MNQLTIGTMSATATLWPEPEQVPEMLRHLADDRLDQALREQPLPDGDWCLRRLDIAVALDPERPQNSLESQWAEQIVAGLHRSLLNRSKDVVHYRRREQAIDDLLSGLAARRHERAWAWRQLRLLCPGDPDPTTDARAVFLRVIARLEPGRAATIGRLIGSVGVAPVHRLLGTDGWSSVASLVAQEAGVSWRSLAAVPMPQQGDPDDVVDRLRDAPSTSDGDSTASTTRALAASLASHPLAVAFRDAGLRADAGTLSAWALLVVAASASVQLRRSSDESWALLAALTVKLAPSGGSTGLGVAAHPGPAANRDRRPSAIDADPSATHHATPLDARTDRSTRRHVDDTDPAGDGFEAPGADEPGSRHSSWGGLLFLLNVAADAGLPDLLDEPPFAARPPSWVLHQLGLALVPADADDPAVLAFAALDEPPVADPPNDREAMAIAEAAGIWASKAAGLLRSPEEEHDDMTILRALARRHSTIQQEPGWVEVHLRLDDVDLDVRRAGLDIDPGWVWWLGQVVRFHYE